MDKNQLSKIKLICIICNFDDMQASLHTVMASPESAPPTTQRAWMAALQTHNTNKILKA